MRLNRGTLIGIVVLVVVIAAALLLLNITDDSGDSASVDSENIAVFPELDAEAVTSLSISRSEQPGDDGEAAVERIAFERADAAWVLDRSASTLEDEGDLVQADVDSLVQALANLQSTDRFSSDDLAQFGLGDPANRIEIGTDDARYQLQLGSKNPQSTRYYALLGDDAETVLLVSSVSQLDDALAFITNPPFVPEPTATPVPVLNIPGPIFSNFGADAINHLEITDNRSGATLLLVRDPASDQWVFEEAPTSAAGEQVDQTVMDVQLSTFGSLSAVDGLTSDNLDNLGLAQPDFTIRAQAENARTYTLQVGGLDPSGTRYYTLVDDFAEVAVVPTDDVDSLLTLLTEPPVAPPATATPQATAEGDS